MVKEQVNKLIESFEKNKDRIYLVDSLTKKQFLYKDIEDLSLRFASLLGEKNIKKGDMIAVFLPNCIEFVLLYFACMQIGAIPVPINPKLSKDEINVILVNSDAKCLVTSKSAEKLVEEMKDSVHNIQSIISFVPSSKDQSCEFLNKIKSKEKYSETSFSSIEDEDTFIIVFTSGTTKQPKGVMVSYKGFIKNGRSYLELQKLDVDSRFFIILSLAYMAGFYNLLLVPFIGGASVVLENIFDLKVAFNFWNTVKENSVNVLWFVPSIMSAILKLDRKQIGIDYCRQSNIKTTLCGTAPLKTSLKKEFEDKYSLTVYENYGSTEGLFVSTNSPSLPKVQGVGKPLPDFELTIIDEDGNICETGKIGDITLKTDQLMKGYYRNPEETGKSMKNGAFLSGDTGYLDEEGYLHVAGRKKDMIIRGGINISPKEIEEVIMNSNLTSEAAVIGMPDELKGEKIVAFINAKPEHQNLKAGDIKEHCKQHLARFKIPEHVFFVKEFPRSVNGKIQKNKLKEIIAEKMKFGE